MNHWAEEPPTSTIAIRRHWLWPTRRRVFVGMLVALAVWGWFDVRNRGIVDPDRRWLHRTDFTVYTEAGAAFFDGRDPYTVTNSRGWGYLYPPLFAILVSPLHALDTRDQVFVWFVLSVLATWGCYRELVRIARGLLPGAREGPFGPVPTWLGVLACMAVLFPTLNCLQRGQVGLAKLYLLLLGFRLLSENRGRLRPLLGGAVLALSVTLKITPLVPAAIAIGGCWVAAGYGRTRPAWNAAWAGTAGMAGGLGLWLFIVPAICIGWSANLRHLESWRSHVLVHVEDTTENDFAGNSTSVRNQSLANAVYRLGNWAHYYFAGGPHDEGSEQLRRGGSGLLMEAPRVEQAVLGVRFLAGCLLLAVGYRMAKSQDRLGAAAAFGLACVSTLVLFTIARAHYYMLWLPGIVFMGLWLMRAGRPRLAVTMAVVPVTLVLGHYAFLNVLGRVGMLGLGTTAWYLAGGAMLLGLRQASRAQLDDSQVPRTSTIGERPLAA